MGRERDYDGEYERERGKQYKKEVSWSGLAKEDRVYEFKLTPAPPGYYKKQQVTKNSLEMMEGYQGAAIKPQFYSLDDRTELPRQDKQGNPTRGQRQPDKQQSPQTEKKPNWFQRIFGGGKQKPKQPGVRDRGNVKNRTPRSQNQGKPKDTPAVANFKQQVKNRANARLDENSKQATRLSRAYTNSKQSKPLLAELRGVVKKDGQLEAQQQELERELALHSSDPTLAGESPAMGGSVRNNPEREAQLEARLQQVKQVRASLLAQYPASGLVKTEEAELGDVELQGVLLERFNGVQQNIASSKEKINSGDVPIEQLEPVIDEVLAEDENLSTQERQEIEGYIAQQRRIDKTIRYGGTAAEVALTAGAVIANIYSGGSLTPLLANFGIAIGIGNAAYEFEQAGDLNTLAKAGAGGGELLIADPDAAQLNRNLAIANLVLAGVDVLAVGVDGAKLANKVLSGSKADVIAKLTPEQTKQFETLASSTDEAQKQQIRQSLKQELGDDFDVAYDTVNSIKASTAKEIDPKVLNKWQTKYPNAVFEADGQVVKVNNQIKIHPSKLDEVDSDTLNKIVQSTQDLNAVGGDITKVNPETRKTIENLTSTKGGRWRFEYQTNGVVNQYLDYVGLKNHKLFQNMTDAEKKRLFDIPNQMNNLDDLPAKAKQKKIDAKAQEKMIEKQAASYAIQQNPKDASEFVNHTEFYKTQMKQRITNSERIYGKNLQVAVNEIAAKEGILPNIKNFTNKQRAEANKKAAQKLFGEQYDEKLAFKSEKEAKKYFKQKTYENAGTGNDLGWVKQQTRDEINNSYQAKLADVGDNVGGIKIDPNLSKEKTIEQIKAKADSLKFGDESAAAYHTEKHYNEFPLSQKTANNQFDNYWKSSIETIKKSDSKKVISSYNQSGGRTFIFQHTYEEQGVSYPLQTIVGVSEDGTVNIRTYFSK